MDLCVLHSSFALFVLDVWSDHGSVDEKGAAASRSALSIGGDCLFACYGSGGALLPANVSQPLFLAGSAAVQFSGGGDLWDLRGRDFWKDHLYCGKSV